MDLECRKARAIKSFLDSIGYRKWGFGNRVVAINDDGKEYDLGTASFCVLANVIDYQYGEKE